jgi:hypothetical protein
MGTFPSVLDFFLESKIYCYATCLGRGYFCFVLRAFFPELVQGNRVIDML